MFYLFTTAGGRAQYKADALALLAYPEGHQYRFRYQERLVAKAIRDCRKDENSRRFRMPRSFDRSGIVVYGEPVGDNGPDEFAFFPLRKVTITAITPIGSAYYVDFILGPYITYRDLPNSQTSLETFRGLLRGLNEYPLPPLGHKYNRLEGYRWKDNQKVIETIDEVGSEGLYFNYSESVQWQVDVSADRSWESIVDTLSQFSTFKSELYFRVEGLYKQRRFLGERLIKATQVGQMTIYKLPMGEPVILKLLYYRPTTSNDGDWSVQIKSSGDGFAGLAPTPINVKSRYNEECVVLACRRTLDNYLSPVEIVAEKTEGAPDSTPSPLLMTQITASKGLIVIVVSFVGLGSLLLAMGPDFLKEMAGSSIMQVHWKWLADRIPSHALSLASWSKVLGAVLVIVAGYLGLRKLPVGGK